MARSSGAQHAAIRPQDVPPFPVLADDLPRDKIVSGIWLWLNELHYRYPHKDLNQWMVDVIGVEHTRHGQRLVANPLYHQKQAHHQDKDPQKATFSSVKHALQHTNDTILRSLARTLQLTPWWITATVQDQLLIPLSAAEEKSRHTFETSHVQTRAILEHFMRVDSRALSDLLPDGYLPVDPFHDTDHLVLPSSRVLLPSSC